MDGVTNGAFDYRGNKFPKTKSVIALHQISYNKIPRFLNQNIEERDQRDSTDRSLLSCTQYAQRERERERERELKEKIEGKGKSIRRELVCLCLTLLVIRFL
jgi:hypothetical protein